MCIVMLGITEDIARRILNLITRSQDRLPTQASDVFDAVSITVISDHPETLTIIHNAL